MIWKASSGRLKGFCMIPNAPSFTARTPSCTVSISELTMITVLGFFSLPPPPGLEWFPPEWLTSLMMMSKSSFSISLSAPA